ncbi:hypothetical protein HAX54_019751 [Datura stramonium]|uniref:Uncharacterized protein n=1 Tax=Datura stramonium TaxID=4076 RepID=A0ABS8RK25_DATST|nr:hypothetical protein [Datura stramonium]
MQNRCNSTFTAAVRLLQQYLYNCGETAAMVQYPAAKPNPTMTQKVPLDLLSCMAVEAQSDGELIPTQAVVDLLYLMSLYIINIDLLFYLF